MPTTTDTRAETTKVVEILSEAESVTLPADEDSIPLPIDPERVEEMGYPLAWLQEVRWEKYQGVYGPETLLKRVEHSTMDCDECDGEGWYDDIGDVICRDCGMVMNQTPMIVPEDCFSGRTGAKAGKGYVFYNAVSSPAINQNIVSQPDEPDVQ